MKKKLFLLAGVLSALASAVANATSAFVTNLVMGPPIMRARTGDVAFTFRMGGGFPGEVNRTHPASIVPGLINTTTPPRAHGDPVLHASDNTLKGVVAGDGSATAINIAGVAVRSFPTQQQAGGMSSSLGASTPPTSGVFDYCSQGFIIGKIPAGVPVVKGGQVFIWCAATSGANVQGSFVGAASSTNTVPVLNAKFNGPADAEGNVEVEVWAAR